MFNVCTEYAFGVFIKQQTINLLSVPRINDVPDQLIIAM